MTERVSIEFEDETVVSSGESDGPESPDGNCIGRACGDGERHSGGGENSGEGRSAFREDRYNKESVRSYARGDGREERPVPLSDDQIMAIERQRFDKESGERTWPVIEGGTAAAQTANAKLEEIPKGKLYELASGTRPVPSSSRIIVARIPGAAKPSDLTNIPARLGVTRWSLETARPSTWQARAAKDIGLAAVDVGEKSLAKGDLEDANQANEIAEGMADIALGVTPGVGWAKDVFEAVTGKNLVTGKDLDGFERSFAIFGAISLGLGSKVGTAIKAANRIGRLAAKLGTADRAFIGARKLAATAVSVGVGTRAGFGEFVDFSKGLFGNEIGAAGQGSVDIMRRLDVDSIQKVWTKNYKFSHLENALDHAKRHGPRFTRLTTKNDYIVGAHSFIRNPPQGTLKKIRGTDRLFYHPESNTFASATEDWVPRTMFQPDDFMDHWRRQSGKDIP